MRLGLGLGILLGALASGCGDDPPTGEETGAETTTGTTTEAGTTTTLSTTNAGADTDDTTGPSPSTSSGSSSSSDGTSSDTTTDTTGTTGSGSESTTGEPLGACELGCITEFACGKDWTSEEECTISCEANLVKAAAFSRPCRAAWEDLAFCLGTLTCEEFAEWEAPAALPYPCSDSDILLAIECKGQ